MLSARGFEKLGLLTALAGLALINLAIGEAAELDAVRTAAQRGRPSALSTGAMRSRDASIFAPP